MVTPHPSLGDGGIKHVTHVHCGGSGGLGGRRPNDECGARGVSAVAQQRVAIVLRRAGHGLRLRKCHELARPARISAEGLQGKGAVGARAAQQPGAAKASVPAFVRGRDNAQRARGRVLNANVEGGKVQGLKGEGVGLAAHACSKHKLKVLIGGLLGVKGAHVAAVAEGLGEVCQGRYALNGAQRRHLA